MAVAGRSCRRSTWPVARRAGEAALDRHAIEPVCLLVPPIALRQVEHDGVQRRRRIRFSRRSPTRPMRAARRTRPWRTATPCRWSSVAIHRHAVEGGADVQVQQGLQHRRGDVGVGDVAGMVAMSGAIMPEPLAMPAMRTLTPSIALGVAPWEGVRGHDAQTDLRPGVSRARPASTSGERAVIFVVQHHHADNAGQRPTLTSRWRQSSVWRPRRPCGARRRPRPCR